MGSRSWFKIWADKWLEGSLRQETPAIRGIFADLLALAASGKYGDAGIIQIRPGVGLSDKQICKILNVDARVWKRSIKCLILSQRCEKSEGNVMRITNWARYQSEYQRQLPYRFKPNVESHSKKLQPGVTAAGYNREGEYINREGKLTPSGKPWKVVNS